MKMPTVVISFVGVLSFSLCSLIYPISANAQTTEQTAEQSSEEVVNVEPPIFESMPLKPFTATYEAYYKGKLAGSAMMQVTAKQGAEWEVKLNVRADRGFVGVLGLNAEQNTVFLNENEHYRPLTQSTVRKGLFVGKKVNGVYDWKAGEARWQGDLKKERTKPIPLQEGDMSALLINLAVMRDAKPNQTVNYRLVDLGRARPHTYQMAADTENVEAGGLSYSALRIWRTNGGKNETIVWVANGVPTPVRMLQREEEQDGIDLRLIEYKEQ